MDKMWTPPSYQPRALPDVRKAEGGSLFDDELPTKASVEMEFATMTRELVSHLNTRPDHVVYVASPEERDQIRKLFNFWKRSGIIGHNPNIRVEYGVSDGHLRVGE